MSVAERLDQARESFALRAWADAFARLSDLDGDGALPGEDLELLATSAFLAGREDASADAWTRAHHEALTRGDAARAARCAFWLAFELFNQGERARAGGWIARAQRILDERGLECAERGYLLLPLAIRCVVEGDVAGGYETFITAARIGERFGEQDLTVMARQGQGRALIRMGKVEDGLVLLDESMAAVEAGDVSPAAVGDVYCSLLEACHEIFDMRRAREWTAALSRWCESQPELVPYRGQCLVRRAEVMQLHGEWREALAEARQACERLSRPPQSAAGAAYYQVAELHRLRGEFDEAEAAYREASRLGRTPQPGLALLRLSQGKVGPARAALDGAMADAHGRAGHARLLPAYVEVALASGDAAAARAAADDLSRIATEMDAPLLHALAAQARGAVLLAEGEPAAALEELRQARGRWDDDLDAPYESARCRVLVGLACRELGDADTAELALDGARSIFLELGAKPDLARVASLTRAATGAAGHGLTPRELQVLRLVAAGATNRRIAERLFISERTVERHVSNIFMKLAVPSRAAATAFAYEHQLI